MTTGLIVVGASLGGAEAFAGFMAGLGEPRVPVALVLHRNRQPRGSLADYLARLSGVPVAEVDDSQPLTPGVHLAPADYHLLAGERAFRLSVDEKVIHARPSIDVLFESAAESHRKQLAAVLLTAASRDGAAGVVRVAGLGGRAYVQDPSTAESSVAPAAALAGLEKVGRSARVGSPRRIGEWLRAEGCGAERREEP